MLRKTTKLFFICHRKWFVLCCQVTKSMFNMFKQPKHPRIAQLPSMQCLPLGVWPPTPKAPYHICHRGFTTQPKGSILLCLPVGFHHPPQRIHIVFAIGVSPPTLKDPYHKRLLCLPVGFHHPPQRIHTVFAIGVSPSTPKDSIIPQWNPDTT